MPYLEDGETWYGECDDYVEGMAENKLGHRKFASYDLPSWSKHPLTHPFSGVIVSAKDYIHAAGDGLVNPMGWSIAHVGAKFGDISILEKATHEELNRQTVEGMTPAQYCVQHATPWCLQWLVRQGVDTNIRDVNGCTAEDLITRLPGLDVVEKEWLSQALKDELNEKNSLKAQEYSLVKQRASGADPIVTERMDMNMDKYRKHLFGIGDVGPPYVPPVTKDHPEYILDLPISKVKTVEKTRPKVPAALIFPGQGSQYIGMLKDAHERPDVANMLRKAEAILGWSPLEIMLKGPEEQINETRFCQPLMLIAGLAAMSVLHDSKPEVVLNPQAMAGLSLGEYTALVASGVLEFEDGLRLVMIRAEAMQNAAELVPQAMCSVAGLDRSVVDKLCEEATSADPSEGALVKVANCLFPKGFTCAGTQKAIDELCKLAKGKNALQAKVIKVSGAFHTRLMQPASDKLNAALDNIIDRMKPPTCALFLNVTGKKIPAGTNPETFVELIKKQLTSEVLWEQSIRAMIIDGVQDFYECGPGKQLKAMNKRIDPDAFKRTENISV